MKVIGRGLIGSAISNAKWAEEGGLVVIAAGVSNSKEIRDSEFSREISLIQTCLLDPEIDRIILISSCSASQHESTPYTRHKRKVESIIIESGLRHHIYRLPQVVGPANNLTLVNYFVKSMISKAHTEINVLAERYLIDIEDLTRIMKVVYERNRTENIILDIAPSHSIKITDMIIEIIGILNIERYNTTLIANPDNYFVDPEKLMNIIGKNDSIFSRDYSLKVLRHWVPIIMKNYTS